MRRPAAALLLALAALLLGCHKPHPRGRWNVVVVMVDTLRADHLGAYGYPRGTSPRFDALAKDAYLFTDARSQSSCTFPSVNSLLTSRYPAVFFGQSGGGMGIPQNVRSLAEILQGRGWSTAAVSSSPVVRATPGRFNPRGGFGRGFQRFDEQCEWREGGCVTNHALAALDRLREPFFLYAHYLDPHAPYTPPRQFRRKFLLGWPHAHWALKGNPKPLTAEHNGGTVEPHTRGDVRFLEGLYDGEIANWDSELGRLVDELQHRQILDRTIFVVVADHGETFLDHPTFGHCKTLYDSEIRTPFLLRLPRQHHGERLAGAVQNLDLVPTIVDLVGLPLAGERFAGSSLVPRLDGDDRGRLSYAAIGARRSVTDGRYKLIHDLRENGWQLYDLRADPGEQHNVIRSERAAFDRLRQRLLAWVQHVEGSNGAAQGEEAIRRLEALGYL